MVPYLQQQVIKAFHQTLRLDFNKNNNYGKKNLYYHNHVSGNFFNAQTGRVGIKTTNPTETLDVNGDTRTDALYLRNPGEPTMTGGAFLPLHRIHFSCITLH